MRARTGQPHQEYSAQGGTHGGFRSLVAARQYAREEALAAWQVFPGDVCIERHDPREADPIC